MEEQRIRMRDREETFYEHHLADPARIEMHEYNLQGPGRLHLNSRFHRIHQHGHDQSQDPGRRFFGHLARLLQCLVSRFAQLGLCVRCVFAQCRMIAPTSSCLVCVGCVFARCRMIASLQYRHAFALAKEP